MIFNFKFAVLNITLVHTSASLGETVTLAVRDLMMWLAVFLIIVYYLLLRASGQWKQ